MKSISLHRGTLQLSWRDVGGCMTHLTYDSYSDCSRDHSGRCCASSSLTQEVQDPYLQCSCQEAEDVLPHPPLRSFSPHLVGLSGFMNRTFHLCPSVLIHQSFCCPSLTYYLMLLSLNLRRCEEAAILGQLELMFAGKALQDRV